jgi:ABC-type sugar transport system substrate-binding protein
MTITRREFTLGALTAAAAGSTPFLVQAQTGKTIAVLFDGLYSEFWVAGIQIIKDEMKNRGFQVLERSRTRMITSSSSSARHDRAQGRRHHHRPDRLQGGDPRDPAANRANIPMVHFNRPPAPSDAYSVAIQADNQKIARTPCSTRPRSPRTPAKSTKPPS